MYIFNVTLNQTYLHISLPFFNQKLKIIKINEPIVKKIVNNTDMTSRGIHTRTWCNGVVSLLFLI